VIKEMGIIETTLITGITAQELRMSINQAYQLSAEWGIHRFLVDASAAISHISLLTYFELPKVFMSLNLPRSSRIAVLSSRSQKGKERARFFENVCRNRGWQVKMFYHRLEALEWLGSEIGQL
jgi:hypothetical protein